MSEHSDELADYFDIGREIDTFRSPQGLLDKVRFYLENDDLRGQMATRARDKVEKRYSFESNWLRYLADIENGAIKTAYPNPGYKVPPTAVNGFLKWNWSFIYGRFKLGQYGLAYQQYKYCRRELEGLACNVSINKWFLKRAVRPFITTFARRILSRNQIHRIKQAYSRFRELVDFDK